MRRALGGGIGLDPCSNKHSVVAADREWAPSYKDGLAQEWTDGSVYVHPPFPPDRLRGTTLADWLAKCADARRRHAGEVIALVPALFNSDAWLEHVWPQARAVCFLFERRMRFAQGADGLEARAVVPCALVFWGGGFERFEREFHGRGATVDLSRVRSPGPRANDALRWLSPPHRREVARRHR